MNIPPHLVAQVAANGSPELLGSFGRLLGFGLDEQSALLRGEFPKWSIFAAGLVAGVAAGILLQRKYPEQISKIAGM